MHNAIDGVVRVPVVFVNAYLVDVKRDVPTSGWLLVDTGLRGAGAVAILRGAAARYGRRHPPRAIVLTHGHFDHSGSAAWLARHWHVPVFAHALELPYLTGRSRYPPADPTVGGALAMMSRAFPSDAPDLSPHVLPLPSDGSIPDVPGWHAMHTPGHTPGHVALWREADALLLAGDALATMNQESWMTTVTAPRELRWPPAPMTTDWQAARESVDRLASLHPRTVAAGHGVPISGAQVPRLLQAFAAEFHRPLHGRYVDHPARADERGVIGVPPRPRDPVGRTLRGGAIAAATLGLAAVAMRAARMVRKP